MQASVKWLKEYVEFNETPEALADKMTMAGVPVEHIEYRGQGIDKVVTGQVLHMEHHPDAEKLWVCTISIGDEKIVIITGAQNVKVGDVVPVALVGAKLPAGQEITVANLRGVESNGMLCSAQELNMDPKILPQAAREGIYILPQDTPVGADIKQVLGLDDVILEFELTANRADCFSMIGLAREVAVLTGGKLRRPFLKLDEKGVGQAPTLINITIEEPSLCSRFAARVLQDVKVGPSPAWLQQKLQAAGMRPINNVVDVTNFVMHEMGQPMHAYDYSLINKHHIIVRRAYEREPLTTLDNVKRELHSDMLVIADETQAIGLAGVMGGLATEVTHTTRTVVLEAAAFNNVSVRRTSRALGLRSEASGRFERGVDAANIIQALDRAASLLEGMGACQVCPDIADYYASVSLFKQIRFNANEINAYLGTNITASAMIEILTALGFGLEREGNDYLVSVPSWRSDVTGMTDLSEEIARVYGFENIPSTTPNGVMVQGRQDESEAWSERVKNILTAVGFDEIITYSFMHPQSLDRLNIPPDSFQRQWIDIMNPITDDFPALRTTMWAGMMDTIVRNLSRKNENMRFFEIGSIFFPKALPLTDFPNEKSMLCGAMCGRKNEMSWNQLRCETDFYDVKGAIETVLQKLGISDYVVKPSNYYCMHPGKTAMIIKDEDVIGVVGELHPKVLAAYGIQRQVYGFELDMVMLERYAQAVTSYRSLPRFPGINRDLAMVLPLSVNAQDVSEAIIQSAGPLLETIKLFDEYTGEQVPPGYRSLAFALLFRTNEKTLTDEEVEIYFKAIVDRLFADFAATLRI